MPEGTYGTDRVSRNDWWNPPPRSYTPEEIELLREKVREAMRELMAEPSDLKVEHA